MSSIKKVSTLKDLGLTHNQARIYLAVIELGPSKADEISKVSEVTRQDIYRVMPSLQALGFMETTLSRPMIFKALPLQEALAILISRREKVTAELKEQTSIILKNHKNKTRKEIDQDYGTTYIPGKRAILDRTRKAVRNAKKSLHSVSSWKNVKEHMSEIIKNPEFKKMFNDNIEIHFVTEKSENSKIKSKSKKGIFSQKPSNIKIRFVTESPQAHVFIIDQKEVFIRLYQKERFGESPSIWSNNPCILAIAQSYFEKMWNNSVDPEDNRKIQINENRAISR